MSERLFPLRVSSFLAMNYTSYALNYHNPVRSKICLSITSMNPLFGINKVNFLRFVHMLYERQRVYCSADSKVLIL